MINFLVETLLLLKFILNVSLKDLQLVHVFVKQRVFHRYELVLRQGLSKVQRILFPHRNLKILRTDRLHNASVNLPLEFVLCRRRHNNYVIFGNYDRL